jgi:hypothetical protein
MAAQRPVGEAELQVLLDAEPQMVPVTVLVRIDERTTRAGQEIRVVHVVHRCVWRENP